MTTSPTPPLRLRMASIVPMYRRGGEQIRKDVRAGLFTRPIKPTHRTALWPAAEVEAIVAARAAGYTPAEIRALVDRLHAEREANATGEA